MSALPVAPALAPALVPARAPTLWRIAPQVAPEPVRSASPRLPLALAPQLDLGPDLGLGLDAALGWPGLEARLSPVLGRHGLVALYHRSVARASRAHGAQRALMPAEVFFQQLLELLGAEIAERLLPDAASRC